MTKKKEVKVEAEIPQVEETVVMEEPVVKTPKIEVKREIKEKPKSKNDWEWVKENKWSEIDFLLNAKGDYGKEEVETIKSWKLGKKSR